MHTQHVHVWLPCFILSRLCFFAACVSQYKRYCSRTWQYHVTPKYHMHLILFWNALWHECRGPAYATPYCRTMIHASNRVSLITSLTVNVTLLCQRIIKSSNSISSSAFSFWNGDSARIALMRFRRRTRDGVLLMWAYPNSTIMKLIMK